MMFRADNTLEVQGQWVEDQIEGLVKIYFSNGINLEYEGEMARGGVREGYGIEYNIYGKRTYQGEYFNDMRHGPGTLF